MTKDHAAACISRWEKMLRQGPSSATTRRLRKAIQIAAGAVREENPERRAGILWTAENAYGYGGDR